MSENEQGTRGNHEEVTGKLVPVLREGIEIVKMVLFRELQGLVASLHQGREKAFINRMSGTVMNELFGTPNPEASFVAFAAEHQQDIAAILGQIGARLEHLRIPLTDALRMSVLCDYQEGVDSSELLSRASDYGILLTEREMPMPHKFIELVRRVGAAFGFITPPTAS